MRAQTYQGLKDRHQIVDREREREREREAWTNLLNLVSFKLIGAYLFIGPTVTIIVYETLFCMTYLSLFIGIMGDVMIVNNDKC